MKKQILAALLVAFVAAAPVQQASAQSSKTKGVIGSVLGGLFGHNDSTSSQTKATSNSSNDGIFSGLTSILNSTLGVNNKKQIVGTWEYQEPAVVFSSNNALKKIGGRIVSAKIENTLQTALAKYGIKKGLMKMTFDKNGNFSQSVSGRTVRGTYTIKDGKVTLKYGGQIKQFVGTTQLDGNDLLIVMDASKLLSLASTVGKMTGNSLLSTASTLLNSFDGMQVGLKLTK